ncbi:hypothetical protein FQN60_004046 [Etheostoma spectabile]|uniref:Uncharacterized protein n=1 Tax=Etheostoma spectabile TaxID=54343 RepID=A0A5J5CSN2_9PERO|nr:hypothetical protein FQN60_004046 [Etheostoma spectabile]
MVSFKELCGLTPAANMKQCILTMSSWLMNSERSLKVTVDLSETYPTMEAQGPVPELLRKVLNAYDMVVGAPAGQMQRGAPNRICLGFYEALLDSTYFKGHLCLAGLVLKAFQMIQTSRTLIESADVVYSKLTQAQRAGLDFHEDLHRIGAKEGLKGRKLQKAMESYAWNITVLKGQADLLKHAKSEALDTLRQIHCAAQSCGLSKNGAASPQLQHHPHHQPQQVHIQQQPQAKTHPQPPPLHQSQTQPQSQTAPQAYLHPHSQLPALPLVQTFSKPPAYTQPPSLPQFQYQSQEQRAAGPLDTNCEKEMVSGDPVGSC